MQGQDALDTNYVVLPPGIMPSVHPIYKKKSRIVLDNKMLFESCILKFTLWLPPSANALKFGNAHLLRHSHLHMKLYISSSAFTINAPYAIL